MSIRPATAEDEPFLWRMLTFAASMDGSDRDIGMARIDPALRGYVEAFGRDDDLGVIAIRAGVPVGAAWLRLQRGEPSPSKLWTPAVPELAIATVPELRGAGAGGAMLRALIERARGRYPAIVLSVREGNPAARLYERCGFVVERRVTNRVGGPSLAMRLAFR